MSERRESYVTDNQPSRWIDICFDDGTHTGVRVRAGTTVIEVQRRGRQKIVDITTCLPIDLADKKVYSK